MRARATSSIPVPVAWGCPRLLAYTSADTVTWQDRLSGDLAAPDSRDPLLAKHGQDVQHRPWPGTERSRSPSEYNNVQACWCRLWVSSRPAEVHLHGGLTLTRPLTGVQRTE